MNTRNKKRKRVETDNVGDYLNELGILDKLLSIDTNDFKGLMDNILLNNNQNIEVNKIRNKLKHDEYSTKYRTNKNNELDEYNNKLITLENENKSYKQKIKILENKVNNLLNKKKNKKQMVKLEKNDELYKQKITELENKNVLLNNRVTYLMKDIEDSEALEQEKEIEQEKELAELQYTTLSDEEELEKIKLLDFDNQFNL